MKNIKICKSIIFENDQKDWTYLSLSVCQLFYLLIYLIKTIVFRKKPRDRSMSTYLISLHYRYIRYNICINEPNTIMIRLEKQPVFMPGLMLKEG